MADFGLLWLMLSGLRLVGRVGIGRTEDKFICLLPSRDEVELMAGILGVVMGLTRKKAGDVFQFRLRTRRKYQ